jgi:uncharacterized membrane protein
MSKTNTYETNLLQHIFQNADIALVGDATGVRGSSTAGSLYVSLHTADPGEAGDQTTNETAYGSYARVAVARSAAGWTVTGNLVENAGLLVFPTCSSGTPTITHFGVGTASSGAGKLLYKGALTANLAVSTGIAPEFAIGAIDILED